MTPCNHIITDGGVTRICTEPVGHTGAHFGRKLTLQEAIQMAHEVTPGIKAELAEGARNEQAYHAALNTMPQVEPACQGDVPDIDDIVIMMPPGSALPPIVSGLERYTVTMPTPQPPPQTTRGTAAQSGPQVVDALPVASLYKDELHMWRMRAAVALDIITDHDRPLSEAINALEHLIQNIDDKLRQL